MRPCSNCRSTDTVTLSTGLLPKIVSVLGWSPQVTAYVCRVCRHIDIWLDEVAPLPEDEATQVAGEPSPA